MSRSASLPARPKWQASPTFRVPAQGVKDAPFQYPGRQGSRCVRRRADFLKRRGWPAWSPRLSCRGGAGVERADAEIAIGEIAHLELEADGAAAGGGETGEMR